MGTVHPFPSREGEASQTGFDRIELSRIVELYGRMVAAVLKAVATVHATL